MSTRIPAALLLAALLTAPVLATVTAAPSSAGNGLLMMIHGRFQPRVNLNPDPNGYPMPPPVTEAAGTTLDGGQIHLQVIPFEVATATPKVVADPVLVIATPTGTLLATAPNAAAGDQRECREETGIPGYQGDLAACLAFAFDARVFNGAPVVTFRLQFTDGAGNPGVEDYNLVAHAMIHNHQNGAPVDLAQVDGNLTQPTPFIVDNAVQLRV